jgi:hypothetical protein
VSGGAPRLTTSASGSAPAAARSLRLTAAALYPRSRQEIQSRRKWTSLDERVLGHHHAVREERGVVADSDREPPPSELLDQSELT